MIEKRISLTGVDLINFSGINDENLNLIKDNFDSTIVFRGDTIYLKGEESEIETIGKLFNELIFLQKRHGGIYPRDVKLVMELIDSGEDKTDKLKEKLGFSQNEIKDVILFKKNDFIKPRTPNQLEYLKKVRDNDIVFAIGPAGTGKTYLAVAFALAALKNKEVSRIVLTRPAVEAGESLGFLPGNLSEKVDPYLRPLYDALEEMIPFEKLETYIEKKVVEVIPLAYMRGRTINNAFVILDEAQNSTSLQMKMFLTRLGPSSKAIVTGDVTQIDLPKRDQSGLVQIQEILKNVEDISFLYFEKADVVRHKLVKDIINAYEKFQGQ
ncbi:MAG: PhoH family protein [Ignavibacteria bacterium]|nr:PhoH family protein [Ignavibacteria bacterium]MBK7160751.1 PhoH family protein [Ignavibacteria bacterium]MBK8383216.1 PhoH family protein [Ignavibacteria bacterium]MBK9403065.1 PhoH family protein [Ignavibacteria bacterium]MBL0107618.1 PhoH family protein [Ignavibacteria bacterium]